MFMIVPILKNNVESRMILNADHIVAVTSGIHGLCVLLTNNEEVCVVLNTEEFLCMLEKTTGKAIVSE